MIFGLEYKELCDKIATAGVQALSTADLIRLFPSLALLQRPVSVTDFATAVSGYLDQAMLQILEQTDTSALRVRDKIMLAIKTRLVLAQDSKAAHKIMFRSLAMPPRLLTAFEIPYKTCDHIWHWAGDVSTDFNFYSKRALLMGVYASVYTYWLEDQSEENRATFELLGRQIDRVLSLGRVRKGFESLWKAARRPFKFKG